MRIRKRVLAMLLFTVVASVASISSLSARAYADGEDLSYCDNVQRGCEYNCGNARVACLMHFPAQDPYGTPVCNDQYFWCLDDCESWCGYFVN